MRISRWIPVGLLLAVLAVFAVLVHENGMWAPPNPTGTASARVTLAGGDAIDVREKITVRTPDERSNPLTWFLTAAHRPFRLTLEPDDARWQGTRNGDDIVDQHRVGDALRRFRYSDVTVRDAAGDPVPTDPSYAEQRGNPTIGIGPMGHDHGGTTSYVLSYRVHGAIRTVGGRRELVYWPAAGNGTVRLTGITVRLDASGAGWDGCVIGGGANAPVEEGGTPVFLPCERADPGGATFTAQRAYYSGWGPELRLHATL